MGLDVELLNSKSIYREVYFESGTTHNLTTMADKAGIYEAIWRPYKLVEGYDIPDDDYEAQFKFEESTIIYAKDIVDIIGKGLIDLKSRPEFFKQFDSSNGWGVYEDFLNFVKKYYDALKKCPDSIVRTYR